MKAEKEFVWLLLLLESPYQRGTFRSNPGCKRDFERVVCAPQKNKEFTLWFQELVDEGCFESVGTVRRRMRTSVVYEGFVVNRRKITKRLSRNTYFPLAQRVFKRSWFIEALQGFERDLGIRESG